MFIKYELTLSRFLCNKIAKGEGRARKRARPNLAGCGEVTSPLFSITSILNANRYNKACRFNSNLIQIAKPSQ